MPRLKTALKTTAIVVLLLGSFAAGWLTGRLGIGSVVEPASLADAERAFADRMKGVTMIGTYTIAGRDGRPPRPDRYGIASVEKVGDDLWRFNASMDCCGLNGRTVPIVVPMRWVGDTPVIMMTDTTLPGIGTFTVRVVFYGDRYIGMFQHGDESGTLSGRIEKAAAAAPP